MSKLIKLSYNHYIVVDDTEEIKQNQWYCNNKVLFLSDSKFDEGNNPNQNKNNKVITHSTEPLEGGIVIHGVEHKQYIQIKYLDLSEVEEEIYGYSVEELLNNKLKSEIEFGNIRPNETLMYSIGLEDGFKVHQELTKDKLFTFKDIRGAIRKGSVITKLIITPNVTAKEVIEHYNNEEQKIIQSLSPKTEWDVEFVNDKIKLI